jgi:predicted Zn-dependent protease
MNLISSHKTARRLLYAGALLFIGLSSASAQSAPKASGGALTAPAEVVLYIHSDLKSTDFVAPLVCALQRALVAPVSTQTLALPLGAELLAAPGQFETSKVAKSFLRVAANDGTPPSFKYLLLPFDLTAETFPYVFSSSYNDTTGRYHVGIVSTFRLDPADPSQPHHDGFDTTARRVYKVMLKSIARLAGFRGSDTCVLGSRRDLEGLDEMSSEFCPESRDVLIAARILKSTQSAQISDCLGMSLETPPHSQVRIVRAGQ